MTRSSIAVSTARSRARAVLLGRADRQREHVGEVPRRESDAARSSRGRSRGSTQTAGGTPPAARAEAGQVGRDGPAGQVDDRRLAVRGEPVGGGHGQHRRPAGQRAARDVHPVDPVGNGDGVPPLLAHEGGPLLLPLADLPRVRRLRRVPAERSWSARSRSTRSRSASILRRSARSPRQIAWPLSPAATRQAATAGRR